VKERARYLIIAILLTILDGAVAVFYGGAIWTARSGDVWSWGLWILLTALGATSLANLWVQAFPGSGGAFGSRSTGYSHGAAPIPVEAREQGDV